MKIFKYLFFALACCLATSCVEDEKDLFSDSAAQRINASVKSYTDLLESSENGWIMNFYPAHDGEMGGVVFTVNFKDGVVSLLSEEDPEAEAAKSLYQVKGEQEVLLTFDSYTELFHQFSEPLGSSAPSGMESDYEFAFKSVSANADTIMLKGKRYAQPLQLIRLKEDAQSYVKEIATLHEAMFAMPHTLGLVNGKDSVEVSFEGDVLEFAEYVDAPTDFDPENKDYIVHDIPFVITKTGAHFQTPVIMNGETFQDLTFDAESEELRAVGANVVFPVVLPEDYTLYEDFIGDWTLGVYNNLRKVDITLEPKEPGKSFTVKGISKYFDMVADYNKTTGRIEIYAQKVGESNGIDVWAAAWALKAGGSLTWSSLYGIQFVKDMSAAVPTYTVKTADNDFVVDSFILWGIKDGASAGGFSSWTFNGMNSYQFPYISSLVKK